MSNLSAPCGGSVYGAAGGGGGDKRGGDKRGSDKRGGDKCGGGDKRCGGDKGAKGTLRTAVRCRGCAGRRVRLVTDGLHGAMRGEA
jgi:hypothetical protein